MLSVEDTFALFAWLFVIWHAMAACASMVN